MYKFYKNRAVNPERMMCTVDEVGGRLKREFETEPYSAKPVQRSSHSGPPM
jgi:hypothetical protein